MREIKFRAWDKQAKEMITTGVEYAVRMLGYGPDSADYSASNEAEASEHMGFGPKDFANFEIMQFTGLHDAEGREIYEGDIVDIKGTGASQVTYQTGAYYTWRGKSPYRLGGWLPSAKLKVIGNIYENPELVKLLDNPDWTCSIPLVQH